MYVHMHMICIRFIDTSENSNVEYEIECKY